MYPLVYIVNSCLFSVNAPFELVYLLKKKFKKKFSLLIDILQRGLQFPYSFQSLLCFYDTLDFFCVTYYMLNKRREDTTLQEPFIKDIL